VVFERYLSNACTDRIHTKCYMCRDNVCRRTPSPSGVHRPLGAGEGGVKNSNNGGWSHSCSGQLPFLSFSALPNAVQYVGQRPTHILVYTRMCVGQDRPRRFYRVGQKVRIFSLEFFTILTLYVHISQKRLKIEAYKQRAEK